MDVTVGDMVFREFVACWGPLSWRKSAVKFQYSTILEIKESLYKWGKANKSISLSMLSWTNMLVESKTKLCQSDLQKVDAMLDRYKSCRDCE